MKLKKLGSFAMSNFNDVVNEHGTVVGRLMIQRRSGWRGGPRYIFYPGAGFEHLKASSLGRPGTAAGALRSLEASS